MTYRQSRPPQAIALRRCPFKRVNCEARRDPNITFVRTEIAVYSPEDGCSQGQRQVHDSTYRVTEEAVVQGCPLPPLRGPLKVGQNEGAIASPAAYTSGTLRRFPGRIRGSEHDSRMGGIVSRETSGTDRRCERGNGPWRGRTILRARIPNPELLTAAEMPRVERP